FVFIECHSQFSIQLQSTIRNLHGDGSMPTSTGRDRCVNEHSACPGARFGNEAQVASDTDGTPSGSGRGNWVLSTARHRSCRAAKWCFPTVSLRSLRSALGQKVAEFESD